jgi:hypothetical protein
MAILTEYELKKEIIISSIRELIDDLIEVVNANTIEMEHEKKPVIAILTEIATETLIELRDKLITPYRINLIYKDYTDYEAAIVVKVGDEIVVTYIKSDKESPPTELYMALEPALTEIYSWQDKSQEILIKTKNKDRI